MRKLILDSLFYAVSYSVILGLTRFYGGFENSVIVGIVLVLVILQTKKSNSKKQ